MRNIPQESQVVVVGAGLAGLAAAAALRAGGLQVLVLEARERIGGRIWTSRAWPDMPMDLGASWVHGVQGNPLTELADRVGARRLGTAYGSTAWFAASGARLQMGSALREAAAAVDRIRQEVDEAPSDLSLAQAVRGSRLWAQADPERRKLLRKWINTFVEHEYAADWEQISAWHLDEDDDDLPGGDVLFPDGFDRLLPALTAGLDIVTGAELRRIAPHGTGARLELADGRRLLADHVVLSLPLGVLQSGRLQFAAPLARSRQRAIGTLRMGLLNKCCLRFDRVAWPDDADWLQWLGPRDGLWGEWVNLHKCAGLPVLMGFNAGAEAAEVERLDDRATAASAHAALQAMFGSSFPAPRAVQITRWGGDLHAGGSYSYNAVGTRPATRRKLAGSDWDGALSFCGEATSSRWFGSAHGAVLSGRKAARKLLKHWRGMQQAAAG